MTTTRLNISSGGPWEAKVGYSRAVRIGSHVWVSGCTAMTPDGLVGKGDLYAQAKQSLKTIEWALDQAGVSTADVVRVVIYLTDIARWEGAGRALGESFAAVRPASTMVEVRALIDPDMLVEIECEAYRP